ncbi:MAG: HD domain-containing protein [Christensenellaceae bacterium]|jgi:uncharacterized protein
MEKHILLINEMIAYETASPKRTQHFLKVHNFARTIGILEELDVETLYILEAAAIVHDIGILPSLEKYGSSNGNLQEAEGPPLAEAMLRRLGYAEEIISRVSYLVGHHHTYSNIDGSDYQILIEADFLVDIYEGNMKKEAIESVFRKIFKTETGKRFCTLMFLQEEA